MDQTINTVEWAAELLKREKQKALYGNVTFKFENGKIIQAKIETSEKPIAIDANSKQ